MRAGVKRLRAKSPSSRQATRRKDIFTPETFRMVMSLRNKLTAEIPFALSVLCRHQTNASHTIPCRCYETLKLSSSTLATHEIYNDELYETRPTCGFLFDSLRFEVVYSVHRSNPNCQFSGVVERSSVCETKINQGVFSVKRLVVWSAVFGFSDRAKCRAVASRLRFWCERHGTFVMFAIFLAFPAIQTSTQRP